MARLDSSRTAHGSSERNGAVHQSLSRVTWRSHVRAMLAIAKKDCLHFLRYPLNAAFRLVDSLVWLTPVFFLGKSFAGQAGNAGFAAYTGASDFMGFVVLGFVLSNFVSAVFWGMGFSLKNEMDSGVLETNWMAPVPRPLFLAGQTLASLLITSVVSAAMLILTRIFFGVHITGNMLGAFSAVIPMLVALYGFGFAFAAIVLLMRDANTLVDVSNYVLIMLTGGMFPVQALPRLLLPVALAIPLTYGYDAVRGSLLHTRTLLSPEIELLVLVAFMAVMVPLGVAVLAAVERRCRVRGTLGLH